MAFEIALDALFDDPHLAEDAIWASGVNGPGVPIRVIRRASERAERFGDSRALLGSLAVDVRRSETASIAEGDTVAIAGTDYRVMAEPIADGLGLVFTLELATA